jgi:hypothetical protein
MSGMTPVPRPRFFLEGRGNKMLALLVVALAVALVKPWGLAGTTTPEPSQARLTTPSPSIRPTPDPADTASGTYDPLIFGDFELQPAWGLWPAGYLVSFGVAMRAEQSSLPSEGPVASGARPEPAAPLWPAAIDIPTGNHLLLIGVNTPNGYSVDDIELTRYLANGQREAVGIVRPPSPWPSHFNVIGIDGGYGVSRTAFWTPGRYRLDLVIDPGTIVRSIEIRIAGTPVPAVSDPPPGQAP